MTKKFLNNEVLVITSGISTQSESINRTVTNIKQYGISDVKSVYLGGTAAGTMV